MTPASTRQPRWWRGAALAALAVLGIGSIIGSGGGDAPQCSFFSNVCEPVVAPFTVPQVALTPQRKSLQSGTAITFTLQISGIGEPAVRWQRSADGGATFVDVAGATGSAYTLANPQPADDGAVFIARVSPAGRGPATASNTATIAVSPAAGVVLADGDFVSAGWTVAALAEPANRGPMHSEEQRADGGNPGSMRRMVHTMTPGPSTLAVYNTAQAAVYEPATQGAITAIDYAEDCSRIASTTAASLASTLLFEQGGRRYVAERFRSCSSAVWTRSLLSTLRAGDFVIVDGPACAAGEACPDFSASGPMLRFGFARRLALGAGSPAASVEHAIDNWSVTVWRK